MLLPFGTPCTTSANKGSFTKTPSMTLTSMFACDMCKTRAQNTHTMHRHRHLDRIVPVSCSAFICDRVHLSLMNCVRHPPVPDSWLRWTCQNELRWYEKCNHDECYESNSCRSGPGRRGGGRTRGSFNSSCHSFRIHSSARTRKTIFASHSCCVKRALLPRPLTKQQKMTLSESAQRARTAKARKMHASMRRHLWWRSMQNKSR